MTTELRAALCRLRDIAKKIEVEARWMDELRKLGLEDDMKNVGWLAGKLAAREG